MCFYRLRNKLLRRGPCPAEGVGVVYSFNQLPRLGDPGCSQSHVLIPAAKVIFLTEGTHFLRTLPRRWVDTMGLPGVAHCLQHCHTCCGQSHHKGHIIGNQDYFYKKRRIGYTLAAIIATETLNLNLTTWNCCERHDPCLNWQDRW